MAVYTHANAQAPVARTNLSAGQLVTGHARYTLGPTLAAGDVIRLFRVPAGARIKNAMIFAQKIDTGGSPAVTLNVGDSTSATRFFSASNVGQAGGAAELAVGAAPKGQEYLAEDTVIATVVAAPATQASGTYFEVYLDYYLS